MHLYIASSWRNTYYPEVVTALRAAGHEVYEFKKDALRVYAIMQEPNVFVIWGGYKTKQPNDIKRLNQYIKNLPQDIII